MRKIYFLFAMFIASSIFGQIINIPDANFKAKLLSANTTNNQFAYNSNNNSVVIDTNGDGQIQVSEALLIKSLSLQPSYTAPILSIVGIKEFSNLSSLSFNGSAMKVTNPDLSDMTMLTELYFDGLPQLTSFNITNCNALNLFHIKGCNALTTLNLVAPVTNFLVSWCSTFTTLDLSGAPNITNFGLVNTKVVSLNLSNMNNLSKVQINQNSNLLNVNFQGSNNIYEALFQSNTNLTSIDLSGKTLMWKVSCEGNTALNSLNVTGCSALQRISVNNSNNLHTIDLAGLSQIQILDFLSTGMNDLNLEDLPLLAYFRSVYGKFVSIDFSHNPLISQIDMGYNLLQMINLKNGSQNFPWQLSIGNNPAMQYICCDINDIALASSILNQYGYTNSQVNSYCSFTPGGIFYKIQGETRYDVNNNGCDPTDLKKALQKFNISGANVTGSVIGNTTGQYFLPVQAGSHTITPVLENPNYFNISPASFTANFPTMTSPLSQNFCMTANGNHDDLEIVIIPVNAARPGFVSEYKVLFKNKGTATQAGNFNFNYDDNLMNLLSTSLATSSQSFGVLNYNFTNLLPFQTRELTLKFTLNTPTATPPLVGGQILNYTAQINGATDETPLDNIFALNQTVVNSFDPNDKTCLEGATIAQAKVGDYVHYVIRFENTGTANAENIVVKDMIDTSKFDINSLVAMKGSHSFVTRITDPNTVEFIFENIQLPFTSSYNNGYVSFKIKTKTTLNFGDSFSNTANIYFDYNAPIITNTATTIVSQILGTQENAKENSFSFYPNPVEDIIHFKTDEKLLKVEIYDVSGRIVGSVNIQKNEANLSFLRTGNYLMKMFTKEKYYVNKIVKK